jgi:hypothetical protein
VRRTGVGTRCFWAATRGGLLLLALAFGAHGAELLPPSHVSPAGAAPVWRPGPGEPIRPVALEAARPSRKRSRKSRLRFKGSFYLEVVYDDNIIHYSDDYLDDFRHGRYPYKFRIETYDDLILAPRLTLEAQTRGLWRRKLTVRLRYTLWRYYRNTFKTNEAYSVRLRQYVGKRDYLEVSAYHAPMAYIRELPDRPPFTPRSVPIEWKPFKYAYNSLSLLYYHRFSAAMSATVRLGRVMRFYNRPFLENDNWEWNGEVGINRRISRRLRVAFKYRYSHADARGYDTVGETKATSDDSDPSYERDSYELTFYVYPRGSLWKTRLLTLRFQYQPYFFISKKPLHEDPFHTGRKDEIYRITLEADSRPLWGPASFSLGYRFTKRVTHSPWKGDIAEDKDYEENRLWLGIDYPF